MNTRRRIVMTAALRGGHMPAPCGRSRGRKTSKSSRSPAGGARASASVRVGEPFALLLTCSVLETDAAKAVHRSVAARNGVGPVPALRGHGRFAGRRSPDAGPALHAVRIPAADRERGLVRTRHRDPGDGDLVSHREPGAAGRLGAGPRADLHPPAIAAARARRSCRTRRATSANRGVPTLGEIADREFRARMLRLVALILFGVVGADAGRRGRCAGSDASAPNAPT